MDFKPQRDEWTVILEQLHYDIVRRDPFLAHKESGSHKAIDVQIDESGQVRLTATEGAADARSESRASPTGRKFQVFVERNRVSIVNYRMQPDDELASVIKEMEMQVG